MIGSLVLASAAALGAAGAEPAATAPAPRPCCYTHPAYVGVCSVVPAEDESCEGILAYLNNPQSAGRTYCNATRLRGSWKNVPCPPPSDKAATGPGPAAGRVRTGTTGSTARR